ncbi:hypothetical protein EV421DRAFT_1399492 [Armillaria borealis]|uniref:Uncharacterized protein n=1 Tax=Armillaria borealis TaxID=47425 RepID=A0AA39MWX1_9AGAR|nr:hypothetical protein EV421DRAFT_1399492 [Armillaria borealis]
MISLNQVVAMSGFTSGTAAIWGSSSISIGSSTGEGGRGESIISMGDDQRRDELGRSSVSLSLDIEITSTGATRLAGLSSATVAARFPRLVTLSPFVPVQRPHFHDSRLFSRSGISRNVALRMLVRRSWVRGGLWLAMMVGRLALRTCYQIGSVHGMCALTLHTGR